MAYEGISGYLHNERQKALQRVFIGMELWNNYRLIWKEKKIHLKYSMVMYGIYNSETIERLINMIQHMHNKTIWNENLFVVKLNNWYQ